MTYSEFLHKISVHAEDDFAAFQRKLIFTRRKILGIRTPILRRLAKEFSADIFTLLSYPDEYYETVFIQLTAVSMLPYEEFVRRLPTCVEFMDNWALCDCFKARCIKNHKEEFLSVLEKIFTSEKEYAVRYVLVVLLAEYVEEKYLPIIKGYIRRADTSPYYVHMAVAWLTAEILVKAYDEGVKLLREGILAPKTHNKAIQKARESYRLNREQKEYLNSLKIKVQKG